MHDAVSKRAASLGATMERKQKQRVELFRVLAEEGRERLLSFGKVPEASAHVCSSANRAGHRGVAHPGRPRVCSAQFVARACAEQLGWLEARAAPSVERANLRACSDSPSPCKMLHARGPDRRIGRRVFVFSVTCGRPGALGGHSAVVGQRGLRQLQKMRAEISKQDGKKERQRTPRREQK